MQDRWEDLQRGGLRILRAGKAGGYTTDAVLLADFAAAKAGQRVVDLGCGGGILPLLLMARQPDLHITGLELDAGLVAMAQRSVQGNGLGERIHILQGDIREVRRLLPPKSADLVISNPPYFEGEGDSTSHQIACDDSDIAGAAAWLLNNGGRFCLCCPAARLLPVAESLTARRLVIKRLRMVASLPDKPPYLCLVEARLGARPGLRWLPQLTLYEAPGQPSAEYRRIYNMEGETD